MSSGLPLEALARDITARLDKSNDQLVAVSIHLAEARERIEAGEAGDITFADWCAQHIRLKDGKIRSLPEIMRLASYGASSDPAVKIQARRLQSTKSSAKSRESLAGSRDPEIANDHQRRALAAAWNAASKKNQTWFLRWIGQ